MKKALLLFLVVASFQSLAQNVQDFANEISIDDYEIVDDTYRYRGTPPEASIGAPFKKTGNYSNSYLDGHLRQVSTGQFKMNYRYLMPGGYDANYAEGYPLILMLHGAVERANCYGDDCYTGYKTTSYRPWQTPPAGISNTNLNNLLNNDHQLLNGGQAHLNARNNANNKKPNDPTLSSKAFPGFIVFPQMLNNWAPYDLRNPLQPGGYTDIFDAIRIVRLMIQEYNVDPDRIYIHGLSNGGRGVLGALVAADWLFAAAAPMSPIAANDQGSYGFITGSGNALNDVVSIPIWVFQGGKDTDPRPAWTRDNLVAPLRNRGANIRYTVYPNLGHGTWNDAYNEADFFPWLLSKRKSDIHTPGGLARICATSNNPARLSLPREFYKYQWEKDGVVIVDSETAWEYPATEPGTYRARFSRVPNPGPNDWNRWSRPVEVTVGAPETPVLLNTKSTMLPDLNGGTTSELVPSTTGKEYRWIMTNPSQGNINLYSNNPTYLNNPLKLNGSTVTTSPLPVTQLFDVRTSYNYYVRVIDIDGCAVESSPRTVWFLNGEAAANNTAIQVKPNVTNFKGAQLPNTSSVRLTWNDLDWEKHYEIWRVRSTQAGGAWTLLAVVGEDVTEYIDRNLTIGWTYYYKIRAISDIARTTGYSPSDVRNSNLPENNVVVTMLSADTQKPTVPQNVQAAVSDASPETNTMKVRVSWKASTDNFGVTGYRISYSRPGHSGTVNVDTVVTSWEVPGLTVNQNYSFTVRALDAAGNISNQSSQATAYTSMTGLFYVHNTKYYTDLTDIPEEQWDLREYFGRIDSLTLEVARQESYFIVRYYGYLYVNTPGNYEFRLRHNDGVRLMVNNQQAIFYNNYVTAGCLETASNSAITLAAGFVPIELRYWQSEDDKCIEWDWKGPDTNNNWVPIPKQKLRTTNGTNVPVPPAPPTGLAAQAISEDEIQVSWASAAADVEIERALSNEGPWTSVERITTGLTYTDGELEAETPYFYRIRTVNNEGASNYVGPVTATTLVDATPPSQPTNLVSDAQTINSISIGWTASTDNVAVTGYEIYVQPAGGANTLHSTVQNTYAQVGGLEPNKQYTIYVVAVDGRNNKSTESDPIVESTKANKSYYVKASGAITALGTWGENTDGTGTAPPDFTTNGQYFIFRVGKSSNNVSWVVGGSASRIVISNGAAVNHTGTGGIQGNVEIQGTGSLQIPAANYPTFVSLSENSTVSYTSTASQQIQAATYGHLQLLGENSTKIFPAGTTVIRGNLTVGNGVAISGAPNNGSTIVLYGNLTVSGSPLFTAANSAVKLELRGPNHQITYNGQLILNELKATQPISITQLTSGSLTLGSDAGGGLSLVEGASLNLPQASSLRIVGAGAINGNNETGKILANGGAIEITSSSPHHSNLYFDQELYNTLSRLSANVTGEGAVRVMSPVTVLDGVKVSNGDLIANGNITLSSDAVKTANLERIEGTGRVVGNVNVQRYISAKEKVYRYFSASVEGLTVAKLQNQGIQVSGNFDGRNISSSPSLYVYGRSAITDKVEWLPYPTKANPAPYNNAAPYNSNAAPFEKGRGYSLYVRNVDELTLNTIGEPFQGQVDFNIISPYTVPAQSYSFDGWNLVGNPYASGIKWSTDNTAWPNRVNIADNIAIRSNLTSTDGQFLYYNAGTNIGTEGDGYGDFTTGVIAPGQAFYVQATGPNASLSIAESAKVTTQQEFYREGAQAIASHLALNLKRNGKFDQAIITIAKDYSDEFETRGDAMKRKNEGIWNFSTFTSDNVNVAINTLGESFCEKSVRLNLQNVAAGNYVIEAPRVDDAYGIGDIVLKDKLLNREVNLRDVREYAFDVTADPATFGENRFEIIMHRPELQLDAVAAASEECIEKNRIVLSKAQKGVTYSLVGADGQVLSASLATSESLDFRVPTAKLVNGVNTFRIKAEFSGCTSAMLDQQISIEYYHTPILTGFDKVICAGEGTTLTASVIGSGIERYEWRSAEGTLIKSSTTETLHVDPVQEETYYTVTAFLKNGCVGATRNFYVVPVNLSEPTIQLNENVLSVDVTGAEEYEYIWTLNGQVIEDAKDNFISINTPGEYQVICKTGSCEKLSRPFMITANEETLNETFSASVFPNPTSSSNINLRVLTPSSENVTIKVIDVLGKEHFLQQYNASELRESVTISPKNALRSGVYYLIIKQNARMKEVKFMVGE